MTNITVLYRENPYDSAELMSPSGYLASAVVLFFIGFFGFFLNLFVIILMCRERQLWTPLNVILFNLVCSDFSVSVLGNPFTLASSIAHYWIFGPVMCVIYGFFMSLLGITSITTLTVLAFERYIMVSRPFHKQSLTCRGAGFIVIGIWAYSLALTTPPLFGWSDYVNESANISCSVNWQEQTRNTMTYIMFLFFFGLVLPVAVITFSYLNIIRTMRENTIRVGRVTKAERRVTYMIAVMIVAFLVAWTPYAILALLTQFWDPNSVTPAMGVVPALVAKSSICYNPLIYVGLNTQFKSSLKHTLGMGGITDNSIAEVNENTLGPHRFESQMTESFAIEKHYKPIFQKESFINCTKTELLQTTKLSISDGNLNELVKPSITYLNANGRTKTKIKHDLKLKKEFVELKSLRIEV